MKSFVTIEIGHMSIKVKFSNDEQKPYYKKIWITNEASGEGFVIDEEVLCETLYDLYDKHLDECNASFQRMKEKLKDNK